MLASATASASKTFISSSFVSSTASIAITSDRPFRMSHKIFEPFFFKKNI